MNIKSVATNVKTEFFDEVEKNEKYIIYWIHMRNSKSSNPGEVSLEVEFREHEY